MTRRDLAKSFTGLLAAIGFARFAPPAAAAETVRYGAVDVRRHLLFSHKGIHLHVWHQGVDVTRRCYFADDTNDGVAYLFKHDASGRPYVDPETRHAAIETVYGITLTAGAPLHGR